MSDPIELDLNNPIFVYYVNVENMPRQRSEETLSNISKSMNYGNITFWVVPTNFSKIECVYDGLLKTEKLKKLYDCVEKIIDDPTFSEFKKEMREILIDEIFDV